MHTIIGSIAARFATIDRASRAAQCWQRIAPGFGAAAIGITARFVMMAPQ